MKNAIASGAKGGDIVEILIKTGLSKNMAKTFAFITQKEEISSVEIERATGLRQPEVSIAIQELRKMGWITKRDIKKEGKGRPVHAYKLAMPFQKIVESIEESQRKKIEEINSNIAILQQLVE